MLRNPLRLRTYLLAAFMVLTMVVVAIAQTPTDLMELQKKGSELRKQGKPDEALKVFSEALTLSPRKAELFMLRGETFRSMKSYELASADFTQALTIDDKIPYAYFARGICYGNRSRYQEALKDFSQVIALKPDAANAYYFRAKTYEHLDQYMEALRDINHAIELSAKDYHAYFLKGEICQLAGQISDAIEAYRKFLSYAPASEDKRIRIVKNRIRNLWRLRKTQSVEASSRPPAVAMPPAKTLAREIDKEANRIYKKRTQQATGLIQTRVAKEKGQSERASGKLEIEEGFVGPPEKMQP
jgi:tetratricopeptide (TPR) repeat protein